MTTPSEGIRSLIDGKFLQPYIWGALDKINQSVISLEVQNEELRRRNKDLVTIANWRAEETPGDPPPVIQDAIDREGVRLLTATNNHFKDCGTWYGDECDCSVRFIGMEESDV